MKTVIAAVNSKYIHTSLAAWYLKVNCGNSAGDVFVKEYTINDTVDSILISLCSEKADVIAFSCYIWNMEMVLKLAGSIKKVLPGVKIVLGGPEVSYDAQKLMEKHPFIDFVISGEGENAFRLLLEHLNNYRTNLDEIEGLTYRENNSIRGKKGYAIIKSLDSLESPYTDEMLDLIGNRIMYFESSRGCPFSCSYCISSTFEGVRYFPMERIKKELMRVMEKGITKVKFVDRTFNCHKQRAKEIFSFIIEKSVNTSFHFEVAADLFDDEMLDILSKAPKGLIQFEIGVQTTNPETLKAIHRVTKLEDVFDKVRRLRNTGNFHIHLDLIAGLPEEDYNSFKNSFNQVYSLHPHQLQLGFLKMLKGSGIRREHERYGYIFRDYPPYEVLSNKYLSFGELSTLKHIEELVERYYNSGRFYFTLKYLTGKVFELPFEFFYGFMEYNLKMKHLERPLPARELYTVLQDYLTGILEGDNVGYVKDLLKLDYLSSDRSGNLPQGMERIMEEGFRDKCFSFLKNEENIRLYLPGYEGMPAKQIFKQVHFEIFDYDVTGPVRDSAAKGRNVVLFNYSAADKVTGLYEFKRVEL